MFTQKFYNESAKALTKALTEYREHFHKNADAEILHGRMLILEEMDSTLDMIKHAIETDTPLEFKYDYKPGITY